MQNDTTQGIDLINELRKTSQVYVASLRSAVESIEKRLDQYNEMIEAQGEEIPRLAKPIRSGFYSFPIEFKERIHEAEKKYETAVMTYTRALERLAQGG